MSSNLVDVFIGRTTDGWMVDAYLAGTTDPVGLTELLSKYRFKTLDDAHRWAMQTFRHRITHMTIKVHS